MSHFVTLVLVPESLKGKAVDNKVNELLAPFDESIEVDEYDKECYCVGNAARDAARKATEKKFPIDKLREEFNSVHVKQVCLKYGIDPSKYHGGLISCGDDRVENELDKIWNLMLKPRQDFQDATEKAHKLYQKPDLKCSECQGKGTRKSTYNPDSKWDWYTQGGRWSGYLPNNKNTITVKELLESKEKNWIPYAVVTPDGRWCQHGEMGWFGMSHDEKDETDWTTEVLEVLKKYPDAKAVCVDCHI